MSAQSSFDAAEALQRLKRSLLGELRPRENELVELCSQAIRVPSPNPPGDTRAIAAFVLDHLAASGLSPQVHAPKADSPNIVATIGAPNARPNIVINAHLDVFPATPEGWTDPPFSGVVKEGRIYGRGASDMKGGVASALFIARLLRGATLARGRITFTFSSDEETGGRWGTAWLLQNLADVRGDACIIGDQLGTWAIGIGEKGMFWIRVRAMGSPGHAAYGSSRSANAKLIKAANLVLEETGSRSSADRELAEVIERQRSEMWRWGPEAGQMLDSVSVNVGVLGGGISPNLVADHSMAEIDIRLPVGIDGSTVLSRIKKRLGHNGVGDVTIETITLAEPTYTSSTSPLVRAVRANTREMRGEESIPVIRLGASDARLFRAFGVPAVVYGPAAYNMGGIDECITVEDLVITTGTHLGATLDLLAGAFGSVPR